MPIVGALVLSLAAAVIAFYSVLAVLDEAAPPPPAGAGTSRLAAFATPALLDVRQASPRALSPVPASQDSARDQAASLLPGSRATMADVPSARVPPIVRRAPPNPDAATAMAPPSVPATVVTEASKPARTLARKPLDTSTRSALGGPKPGATTKSAALPVTPPAKTKAPEIVRAPSD